VRAAPALVAIGLGALAGCDRPTNPVFISVTDHGRVEARLETYLYAPTANGRWPVVILSHGASGGSPKASDDWSLEGAYFTSKGYVVLAPMRRGRGKSTGISLESEEKNCDLSSWDGGLQAAFRDLDAVIDYAQSLPFADANRIALVGGSRGGFLSVAYAAEGRERARVRSVINFVGGWVAQAEDQCPADFNLVSFAKYGRETRTPNLWLYGAGDQLYGDDATKSYAAAFQDAGANVQFHLLSGVDGHGLRAHPDSWRPIVDGFLATHAP
jgi:dienelactone hydrolase